MTNVSGNAKKLALRAFLFQTAISALEKQGWTVERIAGLGKASVRRISRGGVHKKVSIRTSQDTWIAFPRTDDNKAWVTLADVDYVVAASVDNWEKPQFAQVHLIEGNEMRARFNRAYEARKAENHSLPAGRGIWVSLYDAESELPVSLVGAGAGLDNPAIAKVPLKGVEFGLSARSQVEPQGPDLSAPPVAGGGTLTIAEAKRILAFSLGVNEADIKITING